RSDELVQHANVIVQQLIAHINLRIDADAVLADSVVSLSSGLQPQVIEKSFVPGPDHVEPFVAQLSRVDDRASTNEAPAVKVVTVEPFPEHADLTARPRDHDKRKQKRRDQHHCQQHDGQAGEMAADKPAERARVLRHAVSRTQVIRRHYWPPLTQPY